MKSTGSFITGLLAGAAIGGIIALLYAPKSGSETRAQIRQKIEDLEKEFEELKGKAGKKADQMRDDLAQKVANLQKEMENFSKA